MVVEKVLLLQVRIPIVAELESYRPPPPLSGAFKDGGTRLVGRSLWLWCSNAPFCLASARTLSTQLVVGPRRV